MRADRLLWRAFLAFAGLEAAGLFLDRRMLPHSATAAVLVLLLLVLNEPRGTVSRRPVAIGLGLLATAAAVVTARTGGYAWPADWPDDSLRLLLESALLAAAGMALAGSVLRRADPTARRRLRILALTAAAVVAAACAIVLTSGRGPGESWGSLLLRSAVLLVPVVAWVVLACAAVATLLIRGGLRLAGAGLLPLLALAATAAPALPDPGLLTREPTPVVMETPQLSAFWISYEEGDPAEYDRLRELSGSGQVEKFGWHTTLGGPGPVVVDPGLGAVTGAPTWSLSSPADWERSGPAIAMTVLFLGLTAFVRHLFAPRKIDSLLS